MPLKNTFITILQLLIISISLVWAMYIIQNIYIVYSTHCTGWNVGSMGNSQCPDPTMNKAVDAANNFLMLLAFTLGLGFIVPGALSLVSAILLYKKRGQYPDATSNFLIKCIAGVGFLTATILFLPIIVILIIGCALSTGMSFGFH